MSDVTLQIRQIIADQLGRSIEEVKVESSFVEDLGADSLDLVELIMAFEEKFHLEISDEESEKLKTVADVINYVKSKKS